MMVSAYAAGLRLTLATVAAKDRNEVDAGLEVLGLINLKGKIVTGDALHCNRRTISTIVDKGGDYCALKGNQESLLSDARSCLAAAERPKAGKKPPPTAKTETMAHGRIETRVGVVVEAKGLAEHHDFLGLKSVRPRYGDAHDRRRDQHRGAHLPASRKLSPEKLLETARAHWQLDVSFGEDAQRNRKDNGPANIVVLRRRALDVARLDKSKGSLTVKLKRAGWNDKFMLKLLSQMR